MAYFGLAQLHRASELLWQRVPEPYRVKSQVNRLRLLIVPNRKAVFVVDDDPGTLRGVKRLLREHGYDSVLFQSAEAFQNHDEFDQALCVILDINLNDASGIEVRHRFKAAGY